VNTRRRLLIPCLVIFLSMMWSPEIAAQKSPAPLLPAAQEAFDEGMAAVGQQQWTIP
jgi:hypothetical protein